MSNPNRHHQPGMRVPAPVYWASALINGDFSGYDPAEVTQIREWVSRYGWPLDVGPAFIGRYEGQLCELAEYLLPAPR